jgi:hypothetical protein
MNRAERQRIDLRTVFENAQLKSAVLALSDPALKLAQVGLVKKTFAFEFVKRLRGV